MWPCVPLGHVRSGLVCHRDTFVLALCALGPGSFRRPRPEGSRSARSLGASRRWSSQLAQPAFHAVEEFLDVDGLGYVVGGAGVDALLAVALHGAGRYRDDREAGVLG